MWIIFQRIWKQGKDILHYEVKGAYVKLMDAMLRRIYNYKTHYVRLTDLEIFLVYLLDDAIELPPYTKRKWIDTLELSLKYCHKFINSLNRILSQCIET